MLAAVAAMMALIAGALQAYQSLRGERTQAELQRRCLLTLERGEVAFLQDLSELVLRASDGWVPSTEDELLSTRSADAISNQLNVFDSAPVSPARPVGNGCANQVKGSRRVFMRDSIKVVLDWTLN